MTPRLEVRLCGRLDADDLALLFGQVAAEHRFRLILEWTDAIKDSTLVASVARAALEAGFLRVRLVVTSTGLDADGLRVAVAGGLNELDVMLPGQAPWDVIGELRRSGGLRFVTLAWKQEDLVRGAERFNPCAADELKIHCESGREHLVDHVIAGSRDTFRRVAVRGLPLCWLPSLDQARVIANAVQACLDNGDGLQGVALPPFEDPLRCWVPQCGRCSLSLACDGIPFGMFGQGIEGKRRVLPFGGGEGTELPLGSGGLIHAGRPQSFLTGHTHVLAVAAGVRPCGRMVVPEAQIPRQLAFLKSQGMQAAIVEPGDAPGDQDGVSDESRAHVFFSRGPEAGEAADLERAFARAEAGSDPMGADIFSRTLGRLLGYPDCCIQAFVAAGPEASTDSLLRAAHGRSVEFAWELNQLDPRSPFPLVAHVPCRFDCPASIELARRVLATLPTIFPFLQGTAQRLLGRPVLYLGPDCAISFLGRPDPDVQGIVYRRFEAFAAGSGGSGRAGGPVVEVLHLLAAGDHVRLDGRILSVFNGGAQVAMLELPVESKVFGFRSG